MKNVLVLAAGLILFASCKKTDTPPAQSCRLSREVYIEFESPGVAVDTLYFNYKYDEQHRLIYADGENYKITFRYSGNARIRQFESAISNWSDSTVYDEQHRIQFIGSSSAAGPVGMIYSYDADGYLSKIDHSNTQDQYFKWNNGDLMIDSTYSATAVYDYYTDKISRLDLPGFDAMQQEWRSSKHLLKSIYRGGAQPKEFHYYILDADNKVVEDSVVIGTHIGRTSLEYECQ